MNDEKHHILVFFTFCFCFFVVVFVFILKDVHFRVASTVELEVWKLQ